MRRRGLLRNVQTAYPGVLGVTTDKGQQDVKPNVLDAPTESYEIMLLRWQTGVFEVGAPPPEPDDVPVEVIVPTLNSFMRGTNVSGQDSGGSVFAFPGPDVFDYLQTIKKAQAVRLTFRHERMQPTPGGPLSSPYVDRYEELVNHVLSRGGFPIIDPHNFSRYYVGSTFDDFSGPTGGVETIIGQDAGYTALQFGDFWAKLAIRFNDPRIMYNLMNEPYSQVTATLTNTLNTAIAAIRATGSKNLILVPFNGFSNRFGYINDRTAQRAHLNSITDPIDNWAVDYHCYVDNFSEGQTTGVQANFMDDVQIFTADMRADGHKAYGGEFGVAVDAASMRAATTYLSYLETNRDVWIGYAWWTSVMYQDTYMYQLLPTELTDGVGPGPYTDRLQMNVLEALFEAQPAPPVILINATLTGTAKVGQVLGGLPAVFSGFPLPTIYTQWQRGADDIPGATSPLYTATAADIGFTVRRIESAGNGSGFVSSVSPSSAVVVA